MKVSTMITQAGFAESSAAKASTACHKEINTSLKRWLSVSFLLMMIFASLMSLGQATLPHHDPLNYTVPGPLQTQSGWTALNSGDNLAIAAGNLSYSGLPASTGNKLTFDAAGIDAAKLFT